MCLCVGIFENFNGVDFFKEYIRYQTLALEVKKSKQLYHHETTFKSYNRIFSIKKTKKLTLQHLTVWEDSFKVSKNFRVTIIKKYGRLFSSFYTASLTLILKLTEKGRKEGKKERMEEEREETR